MDQRARDVLKVGDDLFGKKATLDSLWQEIALNFYPERADFTEKRNEGEEYADHLFSSYPPMARRELGNLLSASLRPRSQDWFSIHVEDEEIDNGDQEREYLELLTKIQRRTMYEASTGFVRATKQSDHDFAAFGNAVIKFGPNINRDGMLYRNFHLRDNAWMENGEGKVDCNHRNWTPTVRQLAHHFPDTISTEVKKCIGKEPGKEIKCRHVVMPSRLYDYQSKGGKKFPFVSLYVERETETVLEETGLDYFCYVIPRWQTVSGCQYGSSMATAIVLPDGRTTQVVVRTLREAAEKHVDPPMIAVADAIRGDIALYAGGVTTADIEYDERLGEVLRPITREKGNMPIGFEIAEALKGDIRQGFMLDKIQLPESGKDMTAFEVRRRIEEHIRGAAPIFEPIEEEYNSPLCEGTFNVMMNSGAFPLDYMPESLMDKDIRFSFRSPLADMAEQRDAEAFKEGIASILVPGAQIDPALLEHADLDEATRDALRATGWPAKWFKPKEAVAQRRQEMAKAAEMQKGMETIGAAAAIAETGGSAAKTIAEAENAGIS
jgi:hypothetical protein